MPINLVSQSMGAMVAGGIICKLIKLLPQGMGGTRLEPPDDRVQKSISTETTFKDEADRSALIGNNLQG